MKTHRDPQSHRRRLRRGLTAEAIHLARILVRRMPTEPEARAAYEQALGLAPTEAERRHLAGRLREL
ncbi:hypothetical protein [Phytoactinopolyspora endophytica]|uniref:hypothetical protein n=1 Tax=Phytoactinopolyspora endophytica TaxID=1642495 RepID=UPI00101C5896|nr:hypothetical protein [Phytoactinopolyspora endophytica]